MLIAIISGVCVCGCAVGAIGYAAVKFIDRAFDDLFDDFIIDLDDEDIDRKD